MSSADGDRRTKAKGMRGYTLLEISVVIVLVAGMALVVERTLTSTRQADAYLNAMRRAKERCETTSFGVYEAVSASRKLFDNDLDGQAYLTALDLSRFPLAANSRLPTFDELRPLGPDGPGDPRTGNVLFFVREVDPVAVSADITLYPQRFIDVYHFVCCYPHETDRNLVTDDVLRARDLVLWYSIPYPSYQQIQAVPVAERKKLLEALYDVYGFDFAWDACAPIEDAFYEIRENGILSGMPATDYLIREHPGLSEGGMLEHHDAQLARTDPTRRTRSGIFTVEGVEQWAPDGFEVKITGASGHRKVWMHFVVETQATRGQTAIHPATLIAGVRDL